MKDGIKEFSKVINATTRWIGYILLVLRACDVVDWPWYIVLLPQFVAVGLALFFLFIFAIIDFSD